jgi:hypothetical protein
MLLGAMLVLNLRLAGVSMMDWSLPSVERQLRPWALGAVAMVVASGLLMFLGNPPKYLASWPFRFKMVALCLAMVCQFGVLRRFFTADPGLRPRPINLLVAGLSLTLWFSVGWAGRLEEPPHVSDRRREERQRHDGKLAGRRTFTFLVPHSRCRQD